MIPHSELLKALEAFTQPVIDFEKDFAYTAKTTGGRQIILTRERVCVLALARFKELGKLLGESHDPSNQ